jgi:hypothetical protein
VYFEPFNETYYWYQNAQWEQGPELPDSITIDIDTSQVVKLRGETPYVQHSTVCAWSGRQPLLGSVDPIHFTSEAIALSEKREQLRAQLITEEEAYEWLQTMDSESFEFAVESEEEPMMAEQSEDPSTQSAEEMVTGVDPQ